MVAKKCKEKAGKQKKDCLKRIIEEISTLNQKKIDIENLMKDIRTESEKLGYDAVKTNKFETMKTTLEKLHVQKQKEFDSCIEKRKKLEGMKNYVLNIVLLYTHIFFEKHWVVFIVH